MIKDEKSRRMSHDLGQVSINFVAKKNYYIKIQS